MKLRARLVVSAVVIAAVMLATLVIVERLSRDRVVQSSLSELAHTYMQSGERARCESAPSTWTVGHALPVPPALPPVPSNGTRSALVLLQPPPVSGFPPGNPFVAPGVRPMLPAGAPWMGLQLFAYNAALVSANPRAPRLSASQSAGLERVTRNGNEVEQVLVRMPWSEGPCAVILVTRISRIGGVRAAEAPPGLLPLWVPLLLFLVMTAGAVFLAVGPLVRRLRRLTARVRSLAAADYQGDVAEAGRDEVAELSRAFDAAASEIRAGLQRQERREQALREFLENTTHDVSTSLTVLMGHLAAFRQAPALAASPGRQGLGLALDETHYIGALINNLALSARLDAGDAQLSHSTIDLNDVVRRCAARIRPIAEEARISVEFATPDTPTWVEADVTMVEQALGNLLFNAVHHNLRGRHAAVVLDVTRERFDLKVLDDGPGIPVGELSEVLTRYARGNAARTRAPSGRGLGLAIAKQVADRHGWQLRLTNVQSGGTEALISGPVAATEGERERQAV